MCAANNILPKSLHFKLPGGVMDDVQYCGGFSDVLKCECGGREVAVKALRTQGFSLDEMRKVSRNLQSPLPVYIGQTSVRFAEVLQGSNHLEISPTSERVGADGRDHDRESIRHGV
jgi:hypothetical protein